MAVTEEELQEKRERNAEAQAELQRVNEERLVAEQEIANEQTADALDVEYERIQAAIAQAKGLNARATDKKDETVEKSPTVAVTATPPKPDNSAPAANATAEGK